MVKNYRNWRLTAKPTYYQKIKNKKEKKLKEKNQTINKESEKESIRGKKNNKKKTEGQLQTTTTI